MSHDESLEVRLARIEEKMDAHFEQFKGFDDWRRRVDAKLNQAEGGWKMILGAGTVGGLIVELLNYLKR